MQIARESQQNAPTFFTGFLESIGIEQKCEKNQKIVPYNQKIQSKRNYLSCRYELYSRIVGIAMSHQNTSLYTIRGF